MLTIHNLLIAGILIVLWGSFLATLSAVSIAVFKLGNRWLSLMYLPLSLLLLAAVHLTNTAPWE